MESPEVSRAESVDGSNPSVECAGQPIPIRLISGEELARELLFVGPTSAFRKFCKLAGIEPVPGRRDCYDPVAVRHKLNEIQGLGASPNAQSKSALVRSVMRRHG